MKHDSDYKKEEEERLPRKVNSERNIGLWEGSIHFHHAISFQNKQHYTKCRNRARNSKQNK